MKQSNEEGSQVTHQRESYYAQAVETKRSRLYKRSQGAVVQASCFRSGKKSSGRIGRHSQRWKMSVDRIELAIGGSQTLSIGLPIGDQSADDRYVVGDRQIVATLIRVFPASSQGRSH